MREAEKGEAFPRILCIHSQWPSIHQKNGVSQAGLSYQARGESQLPWWEDRAFPIDFLPQIMVELAGAERVCYANLSNWTPRNCVRRNREQTLKWKTAGAVEQASLKCAIWRQTLKTNNLLRPNMWNPVNTIFVLVIELDLMSVYCWLNDKVNGKIENAPYFLWFFSPLFLKWHFFNDD